MTFAWSLCLALVLSPPPAAGPVHGEEANPGQAERAALRDVSERELLAELVPPPIPSDEIRALAARLGAGADAGSALDAYVQRYEAATKDAHARAAADVRPRLAAAYDLATPGVQPTPLAGPEIVSVLQRSAQWRDDLAQADAELFRSLGVLRTPKATVSPGLAAFTRIRDRDDLPAADPAAALRLPDLIDETKLAGADRLRVEEALDRQWLRLAAAIGTRRRELGAIAVDRAQLLAAWGPAWELSASPGVAAERARQLDALAARERATEQGLRTANREAIAALLKLLAPETAARVRDVVDEALWPWLFESERQLRTAVARVRKEAAADLVGALDAMLLDLDRRLDGSRRELSKRAARADELDLAVARSQLGVPPEQAIGVLEAQLALLETLGKRRDLARAIAVQMKQAAQTDPRIAPIFDERVAAIDAERRAAEWRREGITARLAEIKAGTHLEPAHAPGDAPASDTAVPPAEGAR
jgi:hypothetical protein